MCRARLPECGGPGNSRWLRSAYRKWFRGPAPREAASEACPGTRRAVSLVPLSWFVITREADRAVPRLCALFRCISRSSGLGVMTTRAVPGRERASGGGGCVWDGATAECGVRFRCRKTRESEARVRGRTGRRRARTRRARFVSRATEVKRCRRVSRAVYALLEALLVPMERIKCVVRAVFARRFSACRLSRSK